MRQDEHELQKACVNWFGYQYPHLKDLLIAIPNGGKRHVKTAAKLKAEGVKAGVPDLFLAAPVGYKVEANGRKMIEHLSAGFWIEMKTEKGVVRDSQKKYLNLLPEVGYQAVICRSFEEFKKEIELYLNQKRKKDASKETHKS